MSEHIFTIEGAGYIGSILSEHLLRQRYRAAVLNSLSHDRVNLSHLIHHNDLDLTGSTKGERQGISHEGAKSLQKQLRRKI